MPLAVGTLTFWERRLPWPGSTRGHPSAWRSSGQPLVRPPGPVSSRAPGVLRRPGDGAPAATRRGGRGVARTEHDGEGTTPRRRGNAGMHGPSARRRGYPPPAYTHARPRCRRRAGAPPGRTCDSSDRQGKRAGRARVPPRARSPVKAQALRGVVGAEAHAIPTTPPGLRRTRPT